VLERQQDGGTHDCQGQKYRARGRKAGVLQNYSGDSGAKGSTDTTGRQLPAHGRGCSSRINGQQTPRVQDQDLLDHIITDAHFQ
jgi:hypothetical protein